MSSTTVSRGSIVYTPKPTGGSSAVSSVTGNNGITVNNTDPTNPVVGLTIPVVVAYGGTGATSFTANQLLFGNGTSAIGSSANLTWDGTALDVTGNIALVSGHDIRFNGEGDSNWRMGIGLGSFSHTVVGASSSLDIVTGQGSVGPDGFSIGGSGGVSSFEINGNTGKAWFRNPITDASQSNSIDTSGRVLYNGATDALDWGNLILHGAWSIPTVPTSANSLVNKTYADNLINNIFTKTNARAASTASIANLSNFSVTQDGVTLIAGDAFLVKNGASRDGIEAVSNAHNGLYTVGTVVSGFAPLTRSPQASTAAEIAGMYCFVTDGTINGSTGWTLPLAAEDIVLETTLLNYVQFTGAGTYTAGTGLTLTGTQFSITNTGVTIGSYGTATQVGSFTVNNKGQLTAASNTNIVLDLGSSSVTGTLAAARFPALTGDVTTTAGSLATTLASSGVSAGSYGDAADVGTFTVDAKGRLTAASSTAIAISASAITSGILSIARGGTNSGTALNNNRLMVSSGGAIVEEAAITGNKALASNSSGLPVASATTDTELGYVSGVTSAIQTQLNGKIGTTLTSANIFVGNGSNVATAVALSGDASLSNAGALSVNAIHSASTSVNVSSATAPTSGQVLTATSSTAATWQTPASTAPAAFVTKTASYSITTTDFINKQGFLLDTSGGAFTLTLPNPATLNGYMIKIFDSTGFFNTNNLTLARFASEKIVNYAGSKVFQTNYGAWNIYCDGTNWWIL